MKRLLLGLMCCGPLLGWAAEALPPGMMVLNGRPAPGLRLADADGKQTDLKELRGHWVMVHFWASWCGQCRAEMPSLQRLVESGKVPALKLVLVNTAEGDDEIAAFLSLHAPDLVTLMDRDGQVTERWQPRGLPSSFFVDPEGRLRYLALGGRPWDTPAYLRFLQQLAVSAPGL